MFGFQFINEMEAVQRHMEQLFSGVHELHQRGDIALKVVEGDDAFMLRAILPGLDVEKLDISILGRQLKISGDFTHDQPEEGVRWYRRERNHGAFEKVIQLSSGLDADRVEAEYRGGILEVKLPKVASALPKKIAVNAG
ncbi:MAG: Hsp20/alpha crystallin family protein [Desulfuromonadales bacterium]|nr:Hsp20/alpha crystallin family protein [Desulfuromonadales bacterium]MBN2792878.1 Hsp20/alpha crystallin family protein [Desulfuromonadales bacterium]